MIKPSLLLRIAGIYLGLFGLVVLIFAPFLTSSSVQSDDTSGVVNILRGYGGLMIALAVIDLGSRNAEPSSALKSISLGNGVGFGLLAATALLTININNLVPIICISVGIESLLAISFIYEFFRI